MYISISEIDKRIIENACKNLDTDSKDYIEEIKYENYVNTNNLIELIENLLYKIDYLEEKNDKEG